MHTHAHGPGSASKLLRVSLVLTLGYIVLTVVAGIRAHSLALISEAGHNVSDFLALLLSLVAVYLSTRPATAEKSYGYHRAGVMAAFINASTLVVIACLIFIEAWRRLRNPAPVQPQLMMAVAGIGVLMNGAIALMLGHRSHAHDDINLRSAFIHMLGDALSTASVIVGGIAILYTGQYWIDPALSFGIGALILWSSIGIIRESANILLEGTPKGMDTAALITAMQKIEGVGDVHDLHVWSLGSAMHALSCHIEIADIPPSASNALLRQINDMLRERFNIGHTTVQFEHAECDVAHGCPLPVSAAPAHEHGHEHQH